MPATKPIILPDGWQVVQRGDGWYLQRRLPSTEFWIDERGPLKQRFQAVRAYERQQKRAG